jgi:LacI family transcriptional regulator
VAAPPRPVKLQDVAEAAGVSIATASRALAGKTRVSAETTRTVLEAAGRLGYVVDPIARALREGSTRTVGMIVPVIGNPHFSELIAAVEDQLQTFGFELILADSHGEVVQEAKRLRTLVGRRVDGIVVVIHDSEASAPALRQAMCSVPVVQLDRKVEQLQSDFVGIDEDEAMRLILEHLVDRGVHRVVLASADDANSVGRGRREAFERLVGELGLVADPHVIDDFSVQAGRDAADEIVRRGSLPDAVVAGSDINAVGVISRLQSLGVQVPGDILVTGFDGTQLSEVYNPSITTVRQPVKALARNAVSFLLARIADPTGPQRDCRITTELVVRSSTRG